MGLTYDELMAKMKSKSLGVPSEGGVSSYTDAIARVDKVEIVKKSMAPLHPLIGQANDPEQPFLFVTFTVEVDGKQEPHTEAAGLLTKKGDLACYPTSEDGKYAGTLLYDLVHGCKDFSEEQKNKLGEDWANELLTIFNGMKFNTRVKVIKDFMIMETSRQKVKDAQYLATKKDTNSSTSPVINASSESDLPF